MREVKEFVGRLPEQEHTDLANSIGSCQVMAGSAPALCGQGAPVEGVTTS